MDAYAQAYADDDDYNQSTNEEKFSSHTPPNKKQKAEDVKHDDIAGSTQIEIINEIKNIESNSESEGSDSVEDTNTNNLQETKISKKKRFLFN